MIFEVILLFLAKMLKQVSVGSHFNQPIDLPKNLLKISIMFNITFKQSIIFPKKNNAYTLPDGIKHLQIGSRYSKPLNNLPNTMINVKLRSGYCTRMSNNVICTLNHPKYCTVNTKDL